MSNSFPYKNVQLIESGCMTLRLHEKKRRIDYYCFIEILISNAIACYYLLYVDCFFGAV